MIRRHAGKIGSLLLLAGAGLGGCVDDRIVYQDKPMFETPPAAAANFIGYSREESKLTVCGNCHAGEQAEWVETAHAHAWASLEANPAKADYCVDCHTVSQAGNAATEAGGYAPTKDKRYYDVQCESCHGAGVPHLSNPGATQPYASMVVTAEKGCGECHQDTHHPYVEEWMQSGHGISHEAMSDPGHIADNASCRGCHTGEDALKAFGVNTKFIEQAEMDTPGKQLPITCSVCHDPHAKNHEGQLRFPVDVPNEEENLCMKCHHKRGQPDPNTFRGPHSPEGPMLLGYGGWWAPNLQVTGGIIATHGTEKNPKLCAGCHVNKFSVNGPDGKFLKASTGHTFDPIPCVDANGVPTGAHDCEITQRTFKACAVSGCHGSEAAARSALITGEIRLEELAAEIGRLLTKVQPNWQVCRTNNSCGAGSPFNTKDGIYTTAEGSAHNMELGSVERLRGGSAAHNPFLAEALLTASIKQLKIDYPAAAAVATKVNLDNILPNR